MLSQPSSSSQPAPSRAHARFWAGFWISFSLLTILSCGGLFLASGLDRSDLANLQGSTSAWQPRAVTATPVLAESTAGQSTAGDQASLLFVAGDLARNVTSTRVNIRLAPGYLGKPEGDIVAQSLPGEVVEILGERTLADNLVWWRVRYTMSDGRSVDGWIAEATASGVQILASAE